MIDLQRFRTPAPVRIATAASTIYSTLAEMIDSFGYTVAPQASSEVDIALIDAALPDNGALHMVQHLRADAATATVPILVLADANHRHAALQCLANGADDIVELPLEQALLRARLGNALQRRRYVQQLAQEQRRSDDILNMVIPLGVALSGEKDFDRLLESIVLSAMHICDADGGTLYLRNERNELEFMIMRNESLSLAVGGPHGQPMTFAPLRMYDPLGAPNHHYVVTHAALTGASFNIPDAYNAGQFDFSGTRAFDTSTGYHSTSFLTVPLKDNSGMVIGVLQLINACDRQTGKVIGFDPTQQQLIESLSALATSALSAYLREARLHNQIANLRIEIDRNRQSRQVAEITETEYFQTLQNRVRDLRARGRTTRTAGGGT